KVGGFGFALFVALSFVGAPVFAQAPAPANAEGHVLHLHPDPSGSWGTLADLNSPADWKCFDSQTHRVPGDGGITPDPPNTLDHDLSHTHVGVCTPHGAVLDGTFSVTSVVQLKTFHLAGTITDLVIYFDGPCGLIPITNIQGWPLPMAGKPWDGLPTTG